MKYAVLEKNPLKAFIFKEKVSVVWGKTVQLRKL